MDLRHDTPDGGAIFVGTLPADSDIQSSIDAVDEKASDGTETPVPDEGDEGAGGPVTRITDHIASIPARWVRHLVLKGGESAEAIRTRRDELYRNEFPLLRPRFAAICDDCGREFDDTPGGSCPSCGGDIRDPDPQQKRAAERLFESVNPAGESLRDVAKRAEEDQWTTGTSVLVIEHEYYQADGSGLYDRGEIYQERPVGIHRADPLSCVPVVDERGQPGGYWWTCPIHRDEPATSPGRCQHCGAERREVWFMDHGSVSTETEYYFREEVVTWAYPHPRLHGLDGIAPSIHTWLKQSILKLMDRFGASFYDPDSDRLPNQFYILHTSNADAWEEQLNQAREDGDQYSSPIFTNEYNIDDNVQPEIEVVDGTPDELLGQNQEIKSDYKSDIRQAYGISDIHDSDLEDAGGLNNEGLQLEVTDRQIASQQHDYEEGWLDTLMKRLGFDEWRIEFLPERAPDPRDLQQHLRAASFVKQAGGDARIVDGRIEVDDFEVDLDDSDEPPTLSGAPNLPGVGSPIPDQERRGEGAGSERDEGVPSVDDLAATVDTLNAAASDLVNAAVDGKAATAYERRDDVPANVQREIENAILAHDFHVVESADSAQLERFFERKLTQPQGWSMNSLTRSLREQFGYDTDQAKLVAREAVGILNRARENATAQLAENVEDDVLHYWEGPDDDGTTEICEWLKAQTNPDYGGEPVPMDDLRELQREAVRRFGDDPDALSDPRQHFLHPGERHTFKSVLESEL